MGSKIIVSRQKFFKRGFMYLCTKLMLLLEALLLNSRIVNKGWNITTNGFVTTK